jgi:hypothetical protein
MTSWRYVVVVSGCSAEEAELVMNERLAYDEEYGFEYGLDWGLLEGKPAVTVCCKFCDSQVAVEGALAHAGGWVCDECWDERLGATA